jgi:hypothetical protein
MIKFAALVLSLATGMGTGVRVDSPIPGMVVAPKKDKDQGKKERHGDLMLRIQTLTDTFNEKTGSTWVFQKVLWGSASVTADKDAAVVIWEVTTKSKKETEALVFLFTGGRWQVFPEDFVSDP